MGLGAAIGGFFREVVPFIFQEEGKGALFDWAGEGLFGLVGGAASGAAAYYAAKEEGKNDEEDYYRRLRDKDERYKASTVDMEDYAKSYHTLTGGMLTNGLLTAQPTDQTKQL